MTGRPIAMTMMAMTALALTAGTAAAGTLRSDGWTPTSCGTEPAPPTINGSSTAAYNDSIKNADTFQKAAQQYEDCYFKEANSDNHVISNALTDQQHHMQAVFDKLQADSKAAAGRLSKKQ